MRFLKSSALSASLIVAAVSSASLPAEAQGLFDGSWSVRVVAGPGKCANQYFVAIEVADGRISYGGRTAGNVGGSGRLMLSISEVRATGALRRTSGSGRWQSRECRGTWTAQKA